ncbi:glycosyl hydrolase [Aquimarina sp. MMG016]|uniref:glycosyl hydrolase n=1 Tax=Aquimarina sp. MMG016 TaxID=2822690 RepID=UPI001B3A14D8|nr:glycosyl hydrolase [Aquimarina sp. MMG016]MBQ4822347.1 T9SS type A sorting domain-containing protein [Aquimarina sp. MMG016]
MKNRIWLVISLLCLGLSNSFDLQCQIVPVGNGSYTTTFPGVDAAGRNSFPSGTPWLSGTVASKPVPTNDWWSDMIKTDHGAKAFNYPLSFRSLSTGLNVNYTIPLASKAKEYREPMSGVESIVIGTEGLSTSSSTVSDHSDWSVTMNWGDQFYSTVNIGSPFVYFEKSNTAGPAKVAVNFNGNGVITDGNKLIIQNNMNNSNYVVFAPTGSNWVGSNGIYTSTLNGKNYWSMVLLPFGVDINAAIVEYEQYAYVFPDKTTVDWSYNEGTGKVRTTFTVTPDIKEGSNSNVLQGLLPHQWDRLASDSSQPTGNTYPSVRGTIKTMVSNSFIVENTFSGILPTLPDLGKYTDGFDPGTLAQKIDQIKNDGLPLWTDSYNQGQDMNRLIQAARIADQIGNIEARDLLVNTVKTRLEDWLTAESGEVAFLFYYNSDWSALLGYPAGHRQDVNLNDHHFHWGYFIHAAAAIEQFNPGWASQWGEMINLLVRDAANPSRTDTMFPFLRNFSPYAGHSWANGFSSEPLGNDQESTSESMQFNSALIHWGTITNNSELRDLGIYLYTTELSTIQEYWFDVEQRSFQPEYAYEMVARVWASGYDNGTWWTEDVAASYGIQLYPIHGGSLYLGHRTDYVDRVWQEMTQNTEVLSNAPNVNLWYDTYWKFLSFTNPEQALSLYRAYPDRGIKVGVSDAQTYHWLHTMASLGQVAEEITADYPIASVFMNNGIPTYVAHNYSNAPIVVNFSDGYNLKVPANSMATSRDIDVSVTLSSDASVVPVSGNTNLIAEVNGAGVTKVEFYIGERLIGTDTSAPYILNTGALSAGFPKVFAKAYVGNDLAISNVISIQVGTQIAYGGTPVNLPGTIEAGLFDIFEGGNGQGITYSDNDTFNQGNFRSTEGVDANNTNNEGFTVGWIGPSEWMEYTINAANAGRYRVAIRYASGDTNGGGPFWFERDGVKISNNISVPFTGSNWNVWQNVVTEDVNLVAGEQVIRVAIGNGGFNLGKMTFEYIGPPTDEVLTNIIVTPLNSTLIVGDAQQYLAEGIDQYGNPFAISPGWSASCGIIENNGMYTASTAGMCTITASVGEISGTCNVTINEPQIPVLSSIMVTPASDDILINETLQFTAVGYDQFGNLFTIAPTWSATGGTIDINGLYTGSSEGSFTVQATSGSIAGTASINVSDNIQVLSSITISPSDVILSVNETKQFMAEGFDQNGNEMSTNVSWSATGGIIDGQGVYSATAPGNFTIQASDGNISATATVTVSSMIGVCTGAPISGDYTYSASGDTNNPTITFEPGLPDIGSSIAILYYGTYPGGGYPGYIVTPGVPFQINANQGQTVYFYYTYSVPEGGERNTAAEMHSFQVGDCGPPPAPVLSSITLSPENSSVTNGSTLQFTANGLDQFGNPFPISPLWSTDGGLINTNGLYTASQTGVFSITASVEGVSATATITVNDPPILTSLQISPGSSSIFVNETIVFSYSALDQYGNVYPSTPVWSSTGGVIDSTGLYNATNIGTFSINLADGPVNATATVTVNEAPSTCVLTAANGDFTTEVSADLSNPTLTFMPSRPGLGNTILILYYGTNPNGGYPGYYTKPGVPFQINAIEGQKIYFYYTYSLPEGGENNTSGVKNDFIVGNCNDSKSLVKDIDTKISIYPNPMKDRITLSDMDNVNKVNVYDISGKLVLSRQVDPKLSSMDITVNSLSKGLYLIKVYGELDVTIYKVFKD